MDDTFISGSEHSIDRIRQYGLDQPSERVIGILDSTRLKYPSNNSDPTDEYQGNPEIDWIFNLERPMNKPFLLEELEMIFNYEWVDYQYITLYGRANLDAEWNFVFSADSPDSFEQLQIAVHLNQLMDDNEEEISKDRLNQLEQSLIQLVNQHLPEAQLSNKLNLNEAVSLAQSLNTTVATLNKSCIIELVADTAFTGMDAWDALLSLGLVWGDGDLFHWENDDTEQGGDSHFTVWTGTEPGYFLPENIKNGQINPENLAFGFSIPRSVDPVGVFDAMMAATLYCQRRLGGQLKSVDGNIFDASSVKKELLHTIHQLKERGIEPGSETALRLF